MSRLMTSVNSLRPSSLAPVAASVKSCARRASDSMMRSSTASCAILAATFGVIDGSNEVTFDPTLTVGIRGSIHTRDDAATGTEFPTGGKAAPALVETQLAIAGPPVPTVSWTVGKEPSASPAAGAGLWVDRSAATGRAPAHTRAGARAAHTCTRTYTRSHSAPSRDPKSQHI